MSASYLGTHTSEIKDNVKKEKSGSNPRRLWRKIRSWWLSSRPRKLMSSGENSKIEDSWKNTSDEKRGFYVID